MNGDFIYKFGGDKVTEQEAKTLILRERKIYLAEKKYCCLCNADMEEDENKEMQEWFFPTDGFKRWYCSKCSEKAKSIEEEYIKRVNNLREKHE